MIAYKKHANVFGGQPTRQSKKEHNFTYLKHFCLYKHILRTQMILSYIITHISSSEYELFATF